MTKRVGTGSPGLRPGSVIHLRRTDTPVKQKAVRHVPPAILTWKEDSLNQVVRESEKAENPL